MELTLLSLVASNVRKLNIFADDLPQVHQAMASESPSDRQTNTQGSSRFTPFEKTIFVHSNAGDDKLGNVPSAGVSTPSDILRHCKSLANLRTLHLSDQVSSSNLRDIVKQLPHLKDLSFYIDRSNNWSLFACHRDTRNHLTRILDFLASERKLEILRIKGEINAEHEAKSLANIKSLKSLNCSFASPDLVIYLTELTSLRSLRITLLHDMDITSTYLQVIRSCKDLSFLRIFDYNISPNFVCRAAEVLEEIESKNTLHLRVHGRHSSNSLKEFKSNALDHKNLLFRSISATELLTLI
ncbi:hypothetical protein KR200_001881 [Drosophila serrata]|nr:hypothetical protein KR200_001881 [Drosophila serrata]